MVPPSKQAKLINLATFFPSAVEGKTFLETSVESNQKKLRIFRSGKLYATLPVLFHVSREPYSCYCYFLNTGKKLRVAKFLREIYKHFCCVGT